MNQGWNFDNSYTQLSSKFFSKVLPTPSPFPKITIFNNELAKNIGLDLSLKNNASLFSGNDLPIGAQPIAQAYAGHQFGHFNMLGDGRAILLGEQLTPNGERLDIQLKGAGRTPYSRGGDGRAAIGPMLREYIISEAMHHLGIRTTRSLAVVETGESIIRDKELQGAVLTRVASSHIRVGTFQYAAQMGTFEDLKELADYTINRHFPNIINDKNRYLYLFKEVVKLQINLVVQWQSVGFIHGVMNTDNMSICGETIDYGPCAFMNEYKLATVFSSIDHQGRYAYGNQPYIAGWNLARLAESLLPLFHEDEEEAFKLAQQELELFHPMFYDKWLHMMCAKLGIFHPEQEDDKLVHDLLELMEQQQLDYTNTFRALTNGVLENETNEFAQWYSRWQSRLKKQTQTTDTIVELMKQYNPSYIPRNHLVESAIEAIVERDDDSVMKQLLKVLSKPYDDVKEHLAYKKVPIHTTPYKTYCGT